MVAPSNATNQFTYDPVGNLSATSVGSSTALSISQFVPAYGATGSTVTINGTGFDPVAINNVVTVNGAAATVSSASPTALTIVVPLTATSGPISVSDANGNATSATQFILGPILSAGADPTATNLTANQTSTINFSGVAGQLYTLSFTDVSFASSGGSISVTIAQPNSSPLLSSPCTFSADTNCILPALPATGTYIIALVNTSVASTLNFSLLAVPTITGALQLNGNGTAANLLPGQIGQYTFSGQVGQSMGIALSPFATMPANGTVTVTLSDPNGVQIGSFIASATASLYASPLLTTPGQYTVTINPGTIAARFSLLLKSNVTGTLSSGIATNFSTTTNWQAANYSFGGTAQQYLNFLITGNTFQGSTQFNVFEPGGALLYTTYISGTSSSVEFPLVYLPTSGTYNLQIVPQGGGTGGLSVAFNPPHQTGTLAVGGNSLPVNLAAGQMGLFNIDGIAGQRLGLELLGLAVTPTYGRVAITLIDPNGVQIGSYTSSATSFAQALPILATTGRYSVLVDPGINSVTFNLQLSADATGTITIGGSSQNFAPSMSAQSESYTFSGTAGQPVTLLVNSDYIPGVTQINVYQQSSGALVGGGTYTSNGSTAGGTVSFTLPATENYTLRVMPTTYGTGNVTLQLISGLNETININTITPISLTAGQQGIISFSGIAGQSLGLAITGLATVPSGGSLGVTILDPNNNQIAYLGGNALPILTLSGNYTVLLNPGSYAATFNLVLDSDITGTLTIGGSAANFTTVFPGQAVTYTFSSTAGNNAGYSATDTFPSALYEIFECSGVYCNVFAGSTNSVGFFTTSAPGNYIFRIIPQAGTTGSGTAQLTP